MVPLVVYVALIASVVVAFWSSLVEATYLTLRPFSLSPSIGAGSTKANKALEIVSEKTRLVSVTTFVDTVSNIVLATTIGLILSDYFGPLGWVYSTIFGSFIIMTLLYLLPKAIGIENALRMSIALAPSTKLFMGALAPVALPLSSLARALSERLVGKPGYKVVDLAAEFEDVVGMLEKAGHIEPDAGRLLRTALASTKSSAIDAVTPVEDIVSVSSDATIFDALAVSGAMLPPVYYSQHPADYLAANPVGSGPYQLASQNAQQLVYLRDDNYWPAKVSPDDGLASVIEKMQDAGTTIAFAFEGDKMVGMITLSDIIERLLGVKV